MGFNLFKLFFQTFLGKKILRIIQLFIKFSFTFLQWKSLICTQCDGDKAEQETVNRSTFDIT